MQQRSRVALVAAVAALVAAALLLLLRRERAPSAAAPEQRAAAAPEREAASVDPAASPAPEGARASVARAGPAVDEPATAAKEAPEPDAEAPPPRDARGEVHLIVQDARGAAVPNAEVRLVGGRTKTSPGTHWGMAGTQVGRSDRDGAVALSFPLWLSDDLRTDFLTLELRHPEYETEVLDMFEVAPEPRVVVLERGGFLVVSGWIESPSEVVRDVVPRLSDGARVPAGSWLPVKDGRLSNGSVPAGRHAIVLEHAAADGSRWFSEVHEFELAREEQKQLHLQLLPARSLEGVLESEVPRPVRGGEVLLNLMIGAPGGGPKGLRPFRASVREDGRFSFRDLPPGAGQIIGICEGWVSEKVLGTSADHGGRDPEELARAAQLSGVDPRIPQTVDPAAVEGAFELLMEPTATLEATLVGPDGAPVEGAALHVWPNVFWRIGYSQIFLDRTYSGRSDADGRLRIEDLPPGASWFGVEHARLDLPLAEDGMRSGEAELRSGETTRLTLELVAID